jgi:hypothetical protein
MKYSIIHQTLINRNTGEDIVDILGPNYETVLNFWHYVETISKEECLNIRAEYDANQNVLFEETFSHKRLLEDIVDSITCLTENMLWNNCIGRIVSFEGCCIVAWATDELIAMHELFELGHKLLFVPLFNKQ